MTNDITPIVFIFQRKNSKYFKIYEKKFMSLKTNLY